MRKYILIILISFFTSFGVITFNNMNGYCADSAITMGSNGAEILNGVGGAFSNLFDVGIGFDPVSISVNLSAAYDRINASMYQNFGWDLEDAQYWLADNVYGGLDSIAVNTIASALNMDWASLAYQGYKLYSTGSLNDVRNLVIGKVVEGGTEFADVIDNALVYVDDNLLSKFRTVKSDLLSDDSLINMSENSSFLYGERLNLETTIGGVSYKYNLVFDSPVYIYTDTTLTQYGYQCYILYDQSKVSSLGGYVIVGNSIYSISDLRVLNGVNVPIGNYSYRNGILTVDDNNQFGRSVYSSVIIGGYTQPVKDFVTLYPSGDFASTYNNTYADSLVIQNLLDRLKDHWITTDQLENIYDLIDSLSIDAVIDDSFDPYIDWDQDIIDSLTEVIDQILEDNAVIDDSLGVDPDPDPPINNTNQGISVFPDFPIPVLDNFTTILGMPTQFFSIFRPLFLVFGSYFSSLWSFWLFIPSCVVIGFIIWLIH